MPPTEATSEAKEAEAKAAVAKELVEYVIHVPREVADYVRAQKHSPA